MFLKSYNSPLDKFVSKPLGTPVGDKIRYFTILEKTYTPSIICICTYSVTV